MTPAEKLLAAYNAQAGGPPPQSAPDVDDEPSSAAGRMFAAYRARMQADEDEEERKAAARARLEARRAAGEAQWEGIETSQAPPLIGQRGGMDPENRVQGGDLLRQLGRGVEDVANWGQGTLAAGGRAVETMTMPERREGLVAGPMGVNAPPPSTERQPVFPKPIREEAARLANFATRNLSREQLGTTEQRGIEPPEGMTDDFWRDFAENPGEAIALHATRQIPTLVAMFGSGAAAGKAGALGVGFMAEAGSAWNEAKAGGATDEEAVAAAGLTGVANMGLESVPVLGALARMKSKPSASVLKDWAKALLQQAVSEGVTETAQEFNNVLVASLTYADEHEWSEEDFKRISAAGVLGAVLGGGVGAVTAPRGGTATPPTTEGQTREVQDQEATVEEARQAPEGRQEGQAQDAEVLTPTEPAEGEIQFVDEEPGAMEHAGSATSPEAISRQAGGTRFYRIRSSGETVPIPGVDAVDVTVNQGEVKVRVSPNGEAVIEQGRANPAQTRALRQLAPPRIDSPAAEAVAPTEPVARVQEAPSAALNAEGVEAGAGGVTYTARGTEVPFRWRVMDASQLVASHDERFQANPSYPSELQNRARGRPASKLQVDAISRNLQPERLGDSPSAAEGAPLVTPGGVVVSGNGRTLAIRRAYDGGRGDAYRAWVESQVPEHGVERPVLVREVAGDVDTLRVAREANESAVGRLSVTEQAKTDAERLTPELLTDLQVSEAGHITDQGFLRRFVGEVAAEADQGDLIDASGSLSQAGRRRAEAAVLAYAYGPEVVEKVAEVEDLAVRRVAGALLAEAGRMAQLQHAMEQGARDSDLSIRSDLSAALDVMARVRDDPKMDVERYLRQTSLLNAELSPVGLDILGVFGGDPETQARLGGEGVHRSSKRMGQVLRRYQELVDEVGDPRQVRLLRSDAASPVDLWAEAVRTREAAGQSSLFLPDQVRDFEAQAGFIGEAGEAGGRRRAFESQETEKRFRAAIAGVPKPSLFTRMREGLVRLGHAASRELHRIPGGAKHARFRESMRSLGAYQSYVESEVPRRMAEVFRPLTDDQADLFLRKTLLDDLDVVGRQVEDVELPFGLTTETVATEKAKIDAEAGGDPYVTRALEQARKMWNDARETYRQEAQKIGLDTSFLDRRGDAYLHHQVLQYAQVEGRRARGAGGLKPGRRGYQRQLEGSKEDINLDYGAAQGQVLAQLLIDAKTASEIARIQRDYDIMDELRAEAKRRSTKEKRVDPLSLIPEGYKAWQPERGNHFFLGTTLVDRVAQRLLEEDAVTVTPEDTRKALAVGARKLTMVLPEEIADTLVERGQRVQRQGFKDWVWRGSQKLTNGWKKVMLFMPRRWFKYGLRNQVGDVQRLQMGAPGALRLWGPSIRELASTAYGKAPPTGDLLSWMQLGGWQSGLFQQEVEESAAGRQRRMSEVTELEKGIAKNLQDLKNLPRKWFEFAGKHTSLLESVNRYAAYQHFLKQMRSSPDGRPADFAASNPSEVMALESLEERAYWLSNQLLGAYDQVSEFGQFLRQHAIPFWSFQELNVRSHWGLIRNAVSSPEAALRQAKRYGLAGATRAPMLVYRVGKLAGLMVAFEAALYAFNHILFPDEEDDLPDDVQRRPHIVLGRASDGSVRYFDRLSVFAEAREWFGIDEFGYGIFDYLDGRISGKQLAQEVARGPSSKAINSIGPTALFGVKPAMEIATQTTTFPHPRPIFDTPEYVARMAGLEAELRAVTGRPEPAGGYGRSWRGAFFYSAEPGATAYYDTLAASRRFLSSIEEETRSIYDSRRTSALRNYKRALRYGQEDVAAEYLADYKAAGGTARGYRQSLDRMHPLSYVPKKHREAFKAWMRPREQENLERAIEYYEEVFGPKSPGNDEAIRFLETP